MNRTWRWIGVATAGVLVVLALAAGAGAESPPKPEPRLEPKAIEILRAMSARLAAAKTMSFTAVATYESPSRYGVPLEYSTLSEVVLERPDKLRVLTPADGPASAFYLDGERMVAHSPAENVVAVASAPPTIDAALDAAFDAAAIYFPFTDVIVADPYADLAPAIQLAFYIGQSHVVGGTTTDVIAIADDKVFAQIWIGAADKLPRKWRALYAADPARLRQDVELSNWRLDPVLPPDTFNATKALAANRIPFARPDPQPPAGADAPEKDAPARAK